MNLDLSDEQAEALTRELRDIVGNDRYPLSPRIVRLREILNKIRPETERENRYRLCGIMNHQARGDIRDDVREGSASVVT